MLFPVLESRGAESQAFLEGAEPLKKKLKIALMSRNPGAGSRTFLGEAGKRHFLRLPGSPTLGPFKFVFEDIPRLNDGK